MIKIKIKQNWFRYSVDDHYHVQYKRHHLITQGFTILSDKLVGIKNLKMILDNKKEPSPIHIDVYRAGQPIIDNDIEYDHTIITKDISNLQWVYDKLITIGKAFCNHNYLIEEDGYLAIVYLHLDNHYDTEEQYLIDRVIPAGRDIDRINIFYY